MSNGAPRETCVGGLELEPIGTKTRSWSVCKSFENMVAREGIGTSTAVDSM